MCVYFWERKLVKARTTPEPSCCPVYFTRKKLLQKLDLASSKECAFPGIVPTA